MKKLFSLFSLLVCLGISTSSLWAADEVVDFSAQNYTNQKVIENYVGTNFVVGFDKGTNGSNAPKYYTSGTAIRAYGGNTMTVASTTKTITKIEITFGSSDGSNTITSDVETYSDGTWTGSATSVIFTIGGTSGNRRIKGLSVTFATGGTSTPSLSVSPTTIDFGTVEQGDEVDPQTVTVTFANLTGSVTYSELSSPFSASGTISSSGQDITIAANTSTIGEYSQTLTVQSAKDNKSAEVIVAMNVVEPFDGLQLTFPDEGDGGNNISSYTATWSATKGTQSWSIYGFNTNKWGWNPAVIKTGRKKNDNGTVQPLTATIATQVTNHAIGDIVVTVDAVTAAQVTSHKLYVADNANYTNAIEIDGDPSTIAAGNITYTVPVANRANDLYYKLEYVTAGTGSSNGILTISKITYAYANATPQKQSTGLAYEVANHLTKAGASYATPTLTNPNSLNDITYASSDANVVAVDASTGELTIKAAGKAVITASRAEDNTYKAGSASYTIYVTAHAGTQDDPYTVADARLAIDKVGETGIADKYVSGIVSNVKSLDPSQYDRAQYYISDDGERENELYIYNGYYLNGVAFTSVDQLMSGDDVVVKGKLLKYNTTYEVDQNNQLISLNRTKTPAGLAYAVAEIEKNVEDAAFTNPLTNPNSLNITYNSSAEYVATVSTNGEVTIVGIGTTTITASFDGNNSYLSGSASYSIIISDPSLTKVTFDATQASDIAEDNDEGVTKSGINIKTSHTDGVNDQSTAIAYYQTFKNQKLTVTSTVGNIKLIEFTTTGGASYAASGFNGVTNNTWTGNTSSVELTASGNQVRMSKIDVYYKADNRTEAGLEWSTDAIELNVGDAFTAPTLNNPNGIAAGEITIASDNTDLATVNNGVVSLVNAATGTATITATFEGNDDYKSATVSYTITVNAVGAVKNVVILAKYDGKWYALMNEVGSANNTLNALDVVYSESNGAILNLSAEEQAKIIWKRSISSNKATFKNGTNYITGTSGNTNLTLAANECEWTIDEEHYVIGNRTILYNKAGYFKNYAVSNVGGSDYSDYIVVLEDPAFLTQTEIRDELIEGQWGTFCSAQEVKCPSGASFFTIAYANKQQNGVLTKVYFDEIGEDENLQAGKPYIYIANDNAIKGVLSGDAVAQGLNDNGFVGVLSDFDFQVNSDATRNKYYVIYGNQIRLCADGYFKLLAGRAYIDAKDVNLPTREVAAPAPGRRRIGLDNPAAPQVLTDIEATQTTGKAVKMMIGEQLFILRDGKLYDTTGRFITNIQ